MQIDLSLLTFPYIISICCTKTSNLLLLTSPHYNISHTCTVEYLKLGCHVSHFLSIFSFLSGDLCNCITFYNIALLYTMNKFILVEMMFIEVVYNAQMTAIVFIFRVHLLLLISSWIWWGISRYQTVSNVTCL